MQDVLATQAPDDDPHAASHEHTRAQTLAEMRARREALDEQIQSRVTPSEAEQIEAEARAIEGAEALAKLLDGGEKLGRTIQVLRTEHHGLIIFKRCTAIKYKKFQDSGKFETLDFEKFVRPQIVYPSLDRFDRIINEQPMLVMIIGNELGTLAGIKLGELQKK